MRANTKSIKPETQIKNLINQAIKDSRLANNGEVITGEYIISDGIKVFLSRGNRIWKPCAIINHSEFGTWRANLGKGFNVGKPWKDM